MYRDGNIETITENLINMLSKTKDNDEFISWFECNGDYAVLISHNDYIIQFELEKVNPVGKTAKGVKGISLAEGDYVTIKLGEATVKLEKSAIKTVTKASNHDEALDEAEDVAEDNE